MSSLFRRVPDPTENYTASHQGRGVDYDEGFETLPLRTLMWRLEQQVLREFIGKLDLRTVLDFACGTGRITEFLASELSDADVRGIDVAESMLGVARERVPTATFAHSDGRDLASTYPPCSFDLVTAFRFFPNADPVLRADSVAAIAAVLAPGGHLIFNNHRNFWSPSYLARRLRRSAPAEGARNSDLLQPWLDLGFSVVARRSMGVLPQSDEHLYLLSDRVADRVETAIARRTGRRHSAGTNTIWLLRKDR